MRPADIRGGIPAPTDRGAFRGEGPPEKSMAQARAPPKKRGERDVFDPAISASALAATVRSPASLGPGSWRSRPV